MSLSSFLESFRFFNVKAATSDILWKYRLHLYYITVTVVTTALHWGPISPWKHHAYTEGESGQQLSGRCVFIVKGALNQLRLTPSFPKKIFSWKLWPWHKKHDLPPIHAAWRVCEGWPFLPGRSPLGVECRDHHPCITRLVTSKHGHRCLAHPIYVHQYTQHREEAPTSTLKF